MAGVDPETPEQWQEAVDAASFMLYVASAVAYGFVTFTGDVDVERCENVIRRGREKGYHPRLIDELLSEAFSSH